MKGAAIAIALLLAAAPVLAKESPAPGASSERDNLVGFAIAACMAKAYPDGPVHADARAAIAGYVEFGSSGAEAYEAISAHVEADERHYVSHTGAPMHLKRCIDLVHTPAFRTLLNRISR